MKAHEQRQELTKGGTVLTECGPPPDQGRGRAGGSGGLPAAVARPHAGSHGGGPQPVKAGFPAQLPPDRGLLPYTRIEIPWLCLQGIVVIVMSPGFRWSANPPRHTCAATGETSAPLECKLRWIPERNRGVKALHDTSPDKWGNVVVGSVVHARAQWYKHAPE